MGCADDLPTILGLSKNDRKPIHVNNLIQQLDFEKLLVFATNDVNSKLTGRVI